MFYKLGQDSALDALGFTKQAITMAEMGLLGGAIGGIGGAISGNDYSAKRILGGAALGAGAGAGTFAGAGGLDALKNKNVMGRLAKTLKRAPKPPATAPRHPSGLGNPIIKADERASQFMRPQSRSLFEAEGEFQQLLDRLHPGTPAYDNAMTALNKIQKQITRQEATPRARSLAKKHIDRGGGTGGF